MEQSNQIKIVKLYLEKKPTFKLPLSDEGSDYLDSLGIKEHVITWKQLFDQINEEIKIEDKNDESIKRFKVIINRLSFLDKVTIISLLHAISESTYFFSKND